MGRESTRQRISSITLAVLFALVGCAQDKPLAENRTHFVLDSRCILDDGLGHSGFDSLDKLVSNMFDRAILAAAPRHHACLDNTTLGKPHLATSTHSSLRQHHQFRKQHSRVNLGYSALPHIGYRQQFRMKAAPVQHLQGSMLSTGIPATAALSAGQEPNALDSEELESSLLDLCAGTGRGQEIDPARRERVEATVAQLESLYAKQEVSDVLAAVQGVWELVYTNEPLFLATPFWWGVGELSRSVIGGDATKSFFALVNALAEGPLSLEFGKILQNISGDTMVSDVDASLFNGLNATLFTEASLTTTNVVGNFEMTLQQTRLLNTRGLGFRNPWQLDKVALPLATVLSGVAALTGVSRADGGAPSPMLQTVYVGRALRVNRIRLAEDGGNHPQLTIFRRIQHDPKPDS